METLRLKIVLGYDGSGFRGFAEQRDQRTVGGALREALETLCQAELQLVCAGRTDAGVHARHQVVHVDVPPRVKSRVESGQFERSLQKLMEPEVAIRSIHLVPDTFHSRFSVLRRTYRYEVYVGNPLPYQRHSRWCVEGPLDCRVMEEAAQFCVGEHDFSTFCRRPKQPVPVSLVRSIEAAHWVLVPESDGVVYRFEVVGNAFCHQMVRSLVGYLVTVGQGKRSPEEFRLALVACDRSRGVALAPPQGLVLWDVQYGFPLPDEGPTRDADVPVS